MAVNERVSRSFALEQTYVHEVYEQYHDNPRSKPWPKVQEFLEKLEPGALVCDVGCGNGKYLKVNMSIYNLGGEKSIRLSDLARQKQNEVIRLDNLALPFKDNCFDTVLSLSVVHHFATTDRRVSALREMARVLRVGGRMIITVWAMEQDYRKFESQDVLVPWRRPKLKTQCETNSEDHSDSDSNKSFRFRNTFRRKSYKDPYRKTSSGSSTLSSPSETCYGFVRRALQKIAGGGRRVVAGSWFLDNWIACMHKQPPLQKRYDPDGCEYCDCSGCDTVEDQPIELLRIDDEEPRKIPRRQTCPVPQISADIDVFKSRSMNNIRAALENNNNNRCKLKPQNGCNQTNKENSEKALKVTLKKPKLVKQKKSLCDEDADEALDQPTDMKNLVRAMPDFKSTTTRQERGGVPKQRSLNEEILMSTDRLKEKERLRQNIQKQTSLNEDLIYKRVHTFESLRESFLAVASSKSFQMLKNRIKNSTTMEKVSSTSLKNGFVKIFQTWKGAELKSPKDNENLKNSLNCHSTDKESNEKPGERRHSKEDGSDSSKDSSLQSDTSVDSEDSFASVIFVPKSDPMSPIAGTSFSAGPTSPLLKNTSAPQSPRIKQSSCPTSPRVKQVPNNLTKQLSSPKPSTELLTTFFPIKPTRKQMAQKYSVQPIPQFKKTIHNTPPEIIVPNVISPTDEASRAEKLKKIRDILAQKPGFGSKSKSHCPIVRKISDPARKDQSLAKSIPKLLKLEIFNPEEDDDSDNSCVSSPDSVNEKFLFSDESLLEATANVASSLEEAVDKVIGSRPKKKLPSVDVFSILHRRLSSDTTPLLEEDDKNIPNGDSRRPSNTWNEECHKHLTAFADKLSEKLMKELDEYQLTMDNIDDPYIHRLSEELHDLSILSDEIRKQNDYLRLSQKPAKSCAKCKKQCACARPSIKLNNIISTPCVNNSVNPALNSLSKRNYVNINVIKSEDNERFNEESSKRFLIAKGSSSESFDSSDKGSSSNSLLSSGATSINFAGQSIASSVTDLSSTASLVSTESKRTMDTLLPGNLKRRDGSGLSDVSADSSWPSEEVGGEITYHRYYHVFRQGELEKLIEKYVDDLHVVSSTYEHASWCIIAEKVQIWTI
ncbi:unnamed protein product [Ceutorhynchus assimilis]|uniref:Methyltransferase type 11 domain-containing protein n=1 Tax=Ceutorhynchus assimilis TaxID=467358 RepID=A0A9N9MH11_9CUCU|nr:unnamed protein product [Ceutorhynchus assimilis]